MDGSGSEQRDPSARIPAIQQRAGSALFEGIILLAIGFWPDFLRMPVYDPGWTTADYAAAGVIWALRIGGAVMVAIAIASWLSWRSALLADALASLALGLVFMATGAILLMDTGFALVPAVLVLIGFYDIHAARGSWLTHRSLGGAVSWSSSSTGAGGGLLPKDRPVDTTHHEDASAKAEAARRLLATKQESRSEGSKTSGPSEAQNRNAPPPGSQPDAHEADPSEKPGTDRKNDEEPPPDGFLADFGRDDKNTP